MDTFQNSVTDKQSGDLKNDASQNLTDVEFFMLANNITFFGICQYLNSLNSKIIPFSFIEFYFAEVKSHQKLQSLGLSKFFNLYTAHDNERICKIFAKAFPTFAKVKEIKHKSFLLGLDAGNYLEVNAKIKSNNLSYVGSDNRDLINVALNDIAIIAARISSRDELRSIKSRYQDYLVNRQRIIDSAKEKQKQLAQKQVATVNLPKAPAKTKVQQLVIPILKLPLKYPKSSTISRVDSQNIAKKFFSSARLLNILEHYHINGVAFSQGFVDKRLSLYESKENKFSDFF